MAAAEPPSGSGWGSPQLRMIEFELKSRPFPIASFPWRDFISNDEFDPCRKIEQELKALFGPQSEHVDHVDASIVAPFYRALDSICRSASTVEIISVPTTRSKPMLNESSPFTLASSPPGPFTPHTKDREFITYKDRSNESSSRVFARNTVQQDEDSEERNHQSYSSDNDRSQHSETDRTPRPKKVKRQHFSSGNRVQDSDSNAGSTEQSVFSTNIGRNLTSEIENDSETDNIHIQETSSTFGKDKLLLTPVRSESHSAIATTAQLLSSRPSDVTYEPSSPLSHTDLMALPGLSEIFLRDQAESKTNLMVYLLMDAVVTDLLDIQNNELKVEMSYAGDTLKVPIGGHFINTTPDFTVTLQKNEEVISILDFEGKRLKPNMTAEEIFGQRVCHIIGRANHNMASGNTDSRTVYLIVAQHTSVSIFSCKLKWKWLRMIREDDLTPLKRINKQHVKEYGPADLTDPDERLLFVQMLCRLLPHVVNLSKFGNDRNDEDDKNKKDDKDSKDNKDDKDDKDDKNKKE